MTIHSALYIGTKEGMPEKGRKKEEVMESWMWIALIVLALLGFFVAREVIRSLRREEDDLAVADVEDLRDEVIQDAPTAESLRRILRASREVSLAALRRERQARLFRVLLKRRERAERAGAEAESLQDSFYPKKDELGGDDSDQQPGVVASIPAKKPKPSVVSQPPAPGKVSLDAAQTDAYNAGFALAKAGKMRPEMEAEKAKLPKGLQPYFERGWINGGSGMNPTPPTKPSPPPAPPSGQGTQPPAGGTPPAAPGTGAGTPPGGGTGAAPAVVPAAAAAAATGP